MNSTFEVFQYDVARFPFRRLVTHVFETDELEHVHLTRKDLMPAQALISESESRTKFHETYYAKQNSGWPELVELYDGFVEHFVVAHLGEPDFVYQYLPSFRIHLPGDKAVHSWHSDGDSAHGHPAGEINFQVPVTDSFGNNATWIESKPGRRDFRPIELRYGECAKFFGNRLTHGNKINDTGLCRISFDFRVLPRSKYRPSCPHRSLTSNKRYVIGEYYKRSAAWR